MFWMEYVDPLVFFVTVGLIVLVGYMLSSPPTIIYKFPKPKTVNSTTYKDESGVHYKYKAYEIDENDIESFDNIEKI